LDNSHGLTDAVLRSNPGVAEHVQATGVENLSVVTSGALPPNPAEMLGSDSMREVVEQLRGQADIVLFDSPPVLAMTDAAVLARRLDGVLLVNDAGRTRRTVAQHAVEGLRKVSANVLRVVLNRLSSGLGGHYYYYYSDREGGQRKRRRHRSKRNTG
jgi:non-specific protein-tyrosine kinase